MDISISIMDDHPDQLSCEKATKYPGKNLKKKKIVKNLSRQKVVVSSQKQIETRNSKRKQNITKNQVSSWKCLKKKKTPSELYFNFCDPDKAQNASKKWCQIGKTHP